MASPMLSTFPTTELQPQSCMGFLNMWNYSLGVSSKKTGLLC